ncbi:MAG: branched-chain amino acid transaminase [Acidiferrobacterales bacterium]|nr:branched-chain amino acid transaminase [Acidiferrobacterales bacterium]
MTTLAFYEGNIVPIEQATISITNHTLHYGTGCFAGIRGYWNPDQEQLFVFRIEDHFTRFINSAALLHSDLGYSNEELQGFTLELLRQEKWRENVYIRPIAYKDKPVFQVWLHDAEDKVAIFSQPTGDYLPDSKGITVCVSSWRRVDDAAIPARGKVNGTYVNSSLAKSDALLSGFNEAILLNQDGHVSEATAANFMLVRDGKLVTPPITANLLEGVVRRSLIQLAQDELEIEVEQRNIDRSELYMADEAFFCGTGVQMAAVGSIDHRPIGDGGKGPVTQQLGDLFYRILIGENPKYQHWVSGVYDR